MQFFIGEIVAIVIGVIAIFIGFSKRKKPSFWESLFSRNPNYITRGLALINTGIILVGTGIGSLIAINTTLFIVILPITMAVVSYFYIVSSKKYYE